MEFIRKHYLFLLFISILILIAFFLAKLSPALAQTNLVDMAHAFLHGKFALIRPIRVFNDYAFYHNNFYVYYGPMVSVVYMPFVAIFGKSFPQQALMPLVSLLIFIGIYKIGRHSNASSETSLWLSTFFVFGSIFLILSITTISSYNVQLIGLLFLVLALWRYTAKKRVQPFLIGTLIACAGLSRITLYPALIFFVMEILFEPEDIRKKITNLVFLSIPIIISFEIYGGYNYIRFGNIFDTGYGYVPESFPGLAAAKDYGVTSLRHLPGNLYLLLFKAPDPIFQDKVSYVLKFPYLRASQWGMGIFFTSPVIVYLILTNLKTKFVKSSLITIPFLLLIPLCFYGVGIWQYGYRYSLDIYPFIIIILAGIFQHRIPRLAILLILYGILFNFLLMYSIWHRYPFPV